MRSSQVLPVLLYGGSRTRLWPLSCLGPQKQFLALSGERSSKSLFQKAIERIQKVASPEIQLEPTLAVTGEDHRFLVLAQLRELKSRSKSLDTALLLESIGRNKVPTLKVGDVILQIDPRHYRPTELKTLLGDPTKAKTKLGWVPEITLDEMIVEIVANDLDQPRQHALLAKHGRTVTV